MDIWLEKKVIESGSIKYSATLEFPNGARENIWYKVPYDREQEITELADPFLIGAIFFGMALKADIHVHGKVSSVLLENLEEYQAIWQCLKPKDYQKIFISSEQEIIPTLKQNDSAIIPFSGGVDSCFSVYRHTHNLCGRKNKRIKAALMVHGFDIPLVETEMFNIAAEKSTEILNDVGVPLIRVSTNWRDIQRKYSLNWDDCNATAIIAAMNLFQKNYRFGLIATGDVSYKKNPIYGSNPFFDPLLSSESFKIIPDGGAFTRIEKVSLISLWKPANKNIRVCWEGYAKYKNCGICEKCIQTILDYRVTGNKLPECFDNDVSDSQILSVPIKSKYILENFQLILDYAHSYGLGDESWVQALEKRIQWYYHKPLKQRLYKFYKKFTNYFS